MCLIVEDMKNLIRMCFILGEHEKLILMCLILGEHEKSDTNVVDLRRT